MKYYSLYFSILLFAFSCSSKKEVEIIEIETLRESQLYAFQNVQAYMLKHKTENEKIAKQYEAKYESALKENSQKALYYLKRAISLEPTLERYKQLGTFLIDLKKYDETLAVYELIGETHYSDRTEDNSTDVYLFSEPDENLKYEQLVAHLLNDFQPYMLKGRYQEWKDKLLSDKRISTDTSSVFYKKLVYVLNDKEQKDLTFNGVFHYIKDTNAVFEISQKTVSDFEYMYMDMMDEAFKDQLDFTDYNSFLFEAKGKENYYGSFNFTHLHKISPSFIAIVYSVDTSATACPKDMRHIYHRLATYTPNGEIIDSKIVAWQAGEQLATMKYEHGTFSISEQKRTWKNVYDKWDFDNFILKTESIGSKTFQILPDGKIEERSTL